MKPLEFRNDIVPELDISRLEVIIDDDDVKVPLLLSVFHFRRCSTKSFAKEIIYFNPLISTLFGQCVTIHWKVNFILYRSLL